MRLRTFVAEGEGEHVRLARGRSSKVQNNVARTAALGHNSADSARCAPAVSSDGSRSNSPKRRA
eukprot:263563-Pyramimonas_sp.AAC.1